MHLKVALAIFDEAGWFNELCDHPSLSLALSMKYSCHCSVCCPGHLLQLLSMTWNMPHLRFYQYPGVLYLKYIYIKIAFMCGGIVSQQAAASRDTSVYVQQFDPHKQRDKVT